MDVARLARRADCRASRRRCAGVARHSLHRLDADAAPELLAASFFLAALPSASIETSRELLAVLLALRLRRSRPRDAVLLRRPGLGHHRRGFGALASLYSPSLPRARARTTSYSNHRRRRRARASARRRRRRRAASASTASIATRPGPRAYYVALKKLRRKSVARVAVAAPSGEFSVCLVSAARSGTRCSASSSSGGAAPRRRRCG